MERKEYVLKWNHHQSNFIETSTKWLEDKSFADITLVCDGASFSAHQLVLAACSDLLQQLLKSHPSQHPILILKDCAPKELEAILQFIYCGETSVLKEDLDTFFTTAQNLHIKGLFDRPTTSMKRKSPESIEENPQKYLIVDPNSLNIGESSSQGPAASDGQKNTKTVKVIKTSTKEAGDASSGLNKWPTENFHFLDPVQQVEIKSEHPGTANHNRNDTDAVKLKPEVKEVKENVSIEITDCDANISIDSLPSSPTKPRGNRKLCRFCGKTFCDNYTLRRHMSTHLPKDRDFDCPLCNSSYSRKDHLKAHLRRKHPQAREVDSLSPAEHT